MNPGASRAWLLATLFSVVVASLVPLVTGIWLAGGIDYIANPAYLHEYYAPMVREVADGHPLVGNPWFIEHRDDLAPTFIIPYWISAAPLLLGIPIQFAFAINFSLWSLAFGLLLYLLCRRLGMPPLWAAIGTVAAYFNVYGFLLQPVVMQLVYPTFLFFILAFLRWWDRPLDRYRVIVLGAAIALTCYDYQFLMQIAAVFLFLEFGNILYRRDWPRVLHALIAGALALLLGIPYFITALTQLHHPYYFEMMARYGLVIAHTPDVRAYYAAACVLVAAAFAYASRRYGITTVALGRTSHIRHVLLVGTSIAIIGFSNVVTGMDMEIGPHADRFFGLWLLLFSFFAIYILYGARSILLRVPVHKSLILFALVLILLRFNVFYVQAPFRPAMLGEGLRSDLRRDQGMMPALRWLDVKEREPKVIWVEPHNAQLNNNVVIYTKHYLLLGNDGLLQLVSDEEVRERYLLASSISDLTKDRIASDIFLYGFGGYGADTPSVRNREVKYCKMLHLEKFGFACGYRASAKELYTPLFEDLYRTYVREIRPNVYEKLRRFHVDYVIKDRVLDVDFFPEKLPFTKRVYSDERYEIFKVL